MATWTIQISAQTDAAFDASGTHATTLGEAQPGDFDGATINSVSVSGSPSTTVNVTDNDTLGVRFIVETSAGTDIYGGVGSDAATMCYAPLSASGSTIVDGTATSPEPTTAVAADWDNVYWEVQYSAVQMADATRTISWSQFNVVVDYTPASSDTEITTNAPDALILTEYPPNIDYDLQAGTDALVLTEYPANIDYNLQAGVDELTLTENAATVEMEPRVWLNTTETKSGADEMTVTAWSATSITFTDPAGGKTGSLKLGVENTRSGDLGWIDVTVNASGTNVSAGVDALTLTTYDASIDLNIQAGVDALTLTEYAATIDLAIQAGVDALTLTEYPVTLTYDVDVGAGVDALTLTEYPANIDYNLQAGTDALTLTEYSASIDWDLRPGFDALTLATFSASIDYDLQVGLDTLVLTEFPATVSFGVTVEAGVDALTLTEYPATLAYDVNVSTNLDALNLTEYATTVSVGVTVGAGTDALTLTTHNASIDFDLRPGFDALTLTEYAATIANDVGISAGTDALTLTEFAATIANDVGVSAGVDNLTLTEYAATIAEDVGVSAGVDALTLTTYQVVVTTGGDTNVSAGVDTLTLTAYQVGVDTGIEVDQPTGGWGAYNDYQAYLQRKRVRDKERQQVQEEIKQLQGVDREIAQIMQKDLRYEARTQEIAELELLVDSMDVKAEEARLRREADDKIADAFKRASEKRTFSALEAFERQLEERVEMEDFLLLIMTVM